MDTIAYSYTNNFLNQLAYEPQRVDIEAIAVNAVELERKRQKAAAIENLTIKYSVNNIEYAFNVDDISRSRMADALAAAEITGIKTTPWKTADNKIVDINTEQLRAIRALGIQALGTLIIS